MGSGRLHAVPGMQHEPDAKPAGIAPDLRQEAFRRRRRVVRIAWRIALHRIHQRCAVAHGAAQPQLHAQTAKDFIERRPV